MLLALPSLKMQKKGILVDIGAGNGRNLKFTNRTLIVALDLSENLLRNYVADKVHQRIVGTVNKLPFRANSADEIFCIAVIHHLKEYSTRLLVFQELYRVNQIKGISVVTVWRKWRRQQRTKILENIRKSLPIDKLVNHNRPWKDSTGKILGIRFYHYYTWKELYFQILHSNFLIEERSIMGGKFKDGNFLVRLLKN